MAYLLSPDPFHRLLFLFHPSSFLPPSSHVDCPEAKWEGVGSASGLLHSRVRNSGICLFTVHTVSPQWRDNHPYCLTVLSASATVSFAKTNVLSGRATVAFAVIVTWVTVGSLPYKRHHTPPSAAFSLHPHNCEARLKIRQFSCIFFSKSMDTCNTRAFQNLLFLRNLRIDNFHLDLASHPYIFFHALGVITPPDKGANFWNCHIYHSFSLFCR